MVPSDAPVVEPQNRMLPSLLAVKNSLPSGENATAFTVSVCPRSCAIAVKVATLHRVALPPSPPVTATEPLGDSATAVTLVPATNDPSNTPRWASQRLATPLLL